MYRTKHGVSDGQTAKFLPTCNFTNFLNKNHPNGLVVEDYDCGDYDYDDDLGVTLVYKDTKRNIYFVGDFKKTRKYLSELLERFPHLVMYI